MRNNSKARKLQRQVNADAIKAQSDKYSCEHMHVSTAQAKRCHDDNLARLMRNV